MLSSTMADTPVQPVEELRVEQVFSCSPVEMTMVKQIPILKPVEDPMPELVPMEKQVYHEELQSLEGPPLGQGKSVRRSDREELVWTDIIPASPSSCAVWDGEAGGGRVGNEELKFSLGGMGRRREDILVFVSHHPT
ncbi:hypothetical protein WISP_87065 [Willisornis vidua]|uniref:Uncharacterized protein n=1 Tax=Willisornis vidua TaxID=1566151 RepID=A0ABQ9D2N3_9PASS|nr:hypothetical protein WISP_87065 [Willisornis vidua]